MKIIKKGDIMNRRKMTLNEELNQIKKLFGYMNMPLTIKESVSGGGIGKPIALSAIDSGSSMAKYVGTQVAKEIEDAIVLAAKNSDAITQALGKQAETFANLEAYFQGTLRSEVALNAFKLMEMSSAKTLMYSISKKLGPVNLKNLQLNMTELMVQEVQSLKTSLSDLETGLLNQLKDPVTADAAAELAPALITKIKGIIDGISDSSIPATTKQSLLETLDGIEAQANTITTKITANEVTDNLPPTPVVNKDVNVTTGSGTSGYKRIEVSPEDFKIGALRIGGKVEETMTEEQLVNLVDEVIQKRFAWLDSPAYKQRRMAGTLETPEEVDAAILEIKRYMNEDLEIIFKFDPDSYAMNHSGRAYQFSWWYFENQTNIIPANDQLTKEIAPKLKKITILPDTNLAKVKSTVDHEVDHIMSTALDGGTTYKAYKNLKDYLSPKLLKVDVNYKKNNPILSFFEAPLNKKVTDWLEYLKDYPETMTRMNRLHFWFKKEFGLSDQSELTKENIDVLWNVYMTKWRNGEAPVEVWDIKDLLDAFYKTNPWNRTVNKVKMKEDLRTILNATFAIGGFIALNQFNEEE